MSTHQPPQTDADLLRVFIELFDEIDREASRNPGDLLREAGVDPEAFVAEISAAIQKELATSPSNWRNQTTEMEKARAALANRKPHRFSNRGARLTALQWLTTIGGNPAQTAMAAHRNFESQTDEDLDSLISDLEYLIGQRAPDDDTE